MLSEKRIRAIVKDELKEQIRKTNDQDASIGFLQQSGRKVRESNW